MKPKLLLHCCCAPCSSAIVEHLKDHFDITLYFYNPNITSEEEYNLRANEVKRMLEEMELSNKISLIIERYDSEEFFQFAKPLRLAPEGGERCKACYAKRLKKTAEYASDNGFDTFSTTLTISPYKDSAVINSIGTSVSGSRMYMPFDFGFLYIRSLELCEKYNLYQQDYCGCIYSQGI